MSTASPRISLTMIVRDEEARLPACLASVAPFVDEIIVVDTGSKDPTPEIAASYGAKVVHFPWSDDFSAARNESLRHATGKWVLYLDADEVLREGCGGRLRAACESAELAGYFIPVVTPVEHELARGELARLPELRLFRRLPGVRFEGRYYETPIVTGSTGLLDDVEILHTGWLISPEQMDAKRRRNIIIVEKWLAAEPGNPLAWRAFVCESLMGPLFVEFVLRQTTQSTYRHFLDALPLPPEAIGPAFALLGFLLLERGDLGWARECLEAALAEHPFDVLLYVLLGELALRRKRWSEAEDWFTQAQAVGCIWPKVGTMVSQERIEAGLAAATG